MIEGLIYRDETITITTVGQAGLDVDDKYSFIPDRRLLDEILFDIKYMTCAERLVYLSGYEVPNDKGFEPIYFIEPVEYLRYQLAFDVMLQAKGGVVFGLNGTTSIDGGYEYSGQQFTITNGEAVSLMGTVYPSQMGSSVLFRQSVNSLGQTQPSGNMTTTFKVKRVVGIDPSFFLNDCKFPPLPNPNDSTVSTTQPGDLSWREEWHITMPPAETKQPLANNSRPLNILSFLK